MKPTNFNKFPSVDLPDNSTIFVGWEKIGKHLTQQIDLLNNSKTIVAIEFYQGVLVEDTTKNILSNIDNVLYINTYDLMWPAEKIETMVFPDVTNDRIFGYLTRLNLENYFDPEKVAHARKMIDVVENGTLLIFGPGAAFVHKTPQILIYADMARWEIQLRMRTHEVDNLGLKNRNIDDWMLLYKQGYFVDWRVLDRWKKKTMPQWDFVLDTNDRNSPKLIEAKAVREALKMAISRPFSVVPFFDPGPWGGQWMKNNCNLDQSPDNYAWCFNCVPEENSLLLKSGEHTIEIPSINLVFAHPKELLGEPVHARFGDEFPIRYDFLDTIDGGNLSLQVHPLTEYIQEKFGMHYTQDESYYLFMTKPGAQVYLGLKEGVNPTEMIQDLEKAQLGEINFPAEKHVGIWSVKTHDHLMIPAGTVHCSAKDCMVLEISATPYIFTFKMWDWGRLGLDGRPRPINIEHAKNVIQWERTENWVKENLVNRIEQIAEGEGWREEKTGLHEREFIETRRHRFSQEVNISMQHSVYVVCVVEGDEITIESPTNSFEPFVVHYAETFIVPAAVGAYKMKPTGKSVGSTVATITSFVRNNV
jgi:mannose-6-phosphate isomerase class I